MASFPSVFAESRSRVLDRLKSVLAVDVFSPVASEDVDRQLVAAGYPKELIDQLYAFGGLMMAEIASRTAALDGKASGILNWSLAILVALLAGSPVWTATNSWTVLLGVLVAIAGAAVAAGSAIVALRIREWDWPSERDWFRADLFGEPAHLKAYHVLAMLDVHRSQSWANIRRGRTLRLGQFALMAATGIVAAISVIRVSWLFLSGLISS